MRYGIVIVVSMLAIVGAGQVLFWLVDGAEKISDWRQQRRYRNFWRRGSEFPRADIRKAQRPRK